MQINQRVTVVVDSSASHVIRRTARIVKVLSDGKVLVDMNVPKDKKTKVVRCRVRQEQVVVCWMCSAPATERFRMMDWCQECFAQTVDEEGKRNAPKIEDFVRRCSSLAAAQNSTQNLKGIHATDTNKKMRKAMKKNGIPTSDRGIQFGRAARRVSK